MYISGENSCSRFFKYTAPKCSEFAAIVHIYTLTCVYWLENKLRTIYSNRALSFLSSYIFVSCIDFIFCKKYIENKTQVCQNVSFLL